MIYSYFIVYIMNNFNRSKQPKSLSKASLIFGLPRIKRAKTSTPVVNNMSRTASMKDLISPLGDFRFINELDKQIDAQRKDLNERNLALDSLGKHFEAIANACKEEKNKNIELREKAMELQKELFASKKHLSDLKAKNEAEHNLNTQEKNISLKLREKELELNEEVQRLNQLLAEKVNFNQEKRKL